ncbi:unnamed protein product [Trichogramma brassicae]|uniref:Uncharacterized protein n=1 Tax=Trichogramma brassicae TaxID=86971 RepID=A0A6H5IC65_9HYME|nr:unnamed protein product [Trichogramma brassicae]
MAEYLLGRGADPNLAKSCSWCKSMPETSWAGHRFNELKEREREKREKERERSRLPEDVFWSFNAYIIKAAAVAAAKMMMMLYSSRATSESSSGHNVQALVAANPPKMRIKFFFSDLRPVAGGHISCIAEFTFFSLFSFFCRQLITIYSDAKARESRNCSRALRFLTMNIFFLCI